MPRDCKTALDQLLNGIQMRPYTRHGRCVSLQWLSPCAIDGPDLPAACVSVSLFLPLSHFLCGHDEARCALGGVFVFSAPFFKCSVARAVAARLEGGFQFWLSNAILRQISAMGWQISPDELVSIGGDVTANAQKDVRHLSLWPSRCTHVSCAQAFMAMRKPFLSTACPTLAVLLVQKFSARF